MRAVELISSVAAVFTAIALGTAAGHAHELEQVKLVFERVTPNTAAAEARAGRHVRGLDLNPFARSVCAPPARNANRITDQGRAACP
jgi:hypothetical protein